MTFWVETTRIGWHAGRKSRAPKFHLMLYGFAKLTANNQGSLFQYSGTQPEPDRWLRTLFFAKYCAWDNAGMVIRL
jgi:hypothetical protein